MKTSPGVLCVKKKSIQMTKRNEIEKVMLSRRKKRTKTHIVKNKNKKPNDFIS